MSPKDIMIEQEVELMESQMGEAERRELHEGIRD